MFRSPRDVVALVLAVVLAAGMLEWQWGLVSLVLGGGRADEPSYVTVIDDPEQEQAALGDRQPLGAALNVTISDARVGRDERSAWLTVRVRVENDRSQPAPRPVVSLHCAQSESGGQVRDDEGRPPARPLAPGASTEESVDLLLPTDSRTQYAQVQDCIAPAYVEAAVYGEDDANNPLASALWAVPDDLVAELDEWRPPNVPAPPEPPDTRAPDRPYAWAEDDSYSNGYAVAFVRGLSTAEVLRALGPVRQRAGDLDNTQAWELIDRLMPDDDSDVPFVASVAARNGGVVVFSNYGFFTKKRVRALSRGGVAATYSNTVNGDDHILVGRRGRAVREFDPFIGTTWIGPRLPQERGLDFESDTAAASWTLLDRIASISVSEQWMFDEPHPTYVLAGW